VLSTAWVVGILLGSLFLLPWWTIFLALFPFPLIIFFRKQRKLILLITFALLTLCGAIIYYPFSLPDKPIISTYNDKGVIELKGIIKSEPEISGNLIRFRLEAREVKLEGGWQATSGNILIFIPGFTNYSYGDSLQIKGKLESPPVFDDFDYQAYLAHQDIYSTMFNPVILSAEKQSGFNPVRWLYTMRSRLARIISATLPEPQASLAQGILLGMRHSIPEELKYDFSVTGTAHLLAISGINLTIIAGMLISAGKAVFGRRHGIYVWLALCAIWFYAIISGIQAPVIRAAIMSSMFLFAELFGRQKNALPALAFSAAVMAGFDTGIIKNISFQLSFLSMCGLIFISPSLENSGLKLAKVKPEEPIFTDRFKRVIISSLSISSGAIIMILPIIAYYFGIVSLISPITTLLITPFFPAIIFLSALTASTGLVSIFLARIIGWVAWLFLSLMIWIIELFAKIPAFHLKIGALPLTAIWFYYLAVFILILILNYRSAIIKPVNCIWEKISKATRSSIDLFVRIPKRFVILPLLVIAFLTSFAASTFPDTETEVTFLNVGEGDATLIRTGHQKILIDGGPSPEAIALELGKKMPFWDRKLDAVILTHPHTDHLAGLLEVIKRYRVDHVVIADFQDSSPLFREWLDLIQKNNSKIISARAGLTLEMGNGAKLIILEAVSFDPTSNALESENTGIIAKLIYGDISFLFMADAEHDLESRLVSERADLTCTVLKVAHHGSATSSSVEFLAVARPRIAVISTGTDNPFGHPYPEVLERLVDSTGSPETIFRTDLEGSISFWTDGQILKVQCEHPPGK
jgi:competence protein ComEC